MKKQIFGLLTTLLLLTLTACTSNSTEYYPSTKYEKDNVASFWVSESLPTVSLSDEEYDMFISSLNYDSIICPFGEIFGIDEALLRKNTYNFDTIVHTYNFFESSSSVDADKLFDTVKNNNASYLTGTQKYMKKELPDSELKYVCGIIADTVNRVVSSNINIDTENLGCVLSNLKVVESNSVNNGSFSGRDYVLSLTPEIIEATQNQSNEKDLYQKTIVHETIHMMQTRCVDSSDNENDIFIGTSYFFDDLNINPLNHSWIYESSAELNTAIMFDSEPSTYTQMIKNLETVNLATVLNDDHNPDQLRQYSYTNDETSLYNHIGFSDMSKAVEFLYAVEILRTKPEDFKLLYESKYSAPNDYDTFIQTTYNPYFVEVTSKLFYKTLASKLKQNEISLSDVFYLISLYELDLISDIPFGIDEVRNQYADTYNKYVQMQNSFFALLQNHTDYNVNDSFRSYSANYGDSTIYANASLDWLNTEKKEYLLSRNNDLYIKNAKKIAYCTPDSTN